MRMKNRLFPALMLAASVAPVPPAAAQAQKVAIAAPADQPYRFRHSGLTIPTVLEGMPRTSIEQFGSDELDVFANYQRGSDAVTVYVYRMVSGAVPVWFDRARASIETRRDLYGAVTAAVPPTAFTPPGQGVASGLIGAWSTGKPPYRGTSLALLPLGDWLVKVRYSSTTLDGAQIAARMPAVLAALTWPSGVAPAAPAQPIADCATPLAYPKKAKVVRDQSSLTTASFLGGLLAAVERRVAETKPSTPPLWCRDPDGSPMGGVYRANNASDSYLLALSDAGRGVWVGPEPLGALLDKKAKPSWSVALADLGETLSYPPMTALPRPAEVLSLIQRPALSRTSTWGDNGQVNIDVNINGIGGKR